MIATPTFTAPLGDTLTRDRVRSFSDSNVISSRGPLWGVYNPVDSYFLVRNIYELVADNMGMIIREAPLDFIRVEGGAFFGETLRDIGGTENHIWAGTSQSVFGGGLRARVYDLAWLHHAGTPNTVTVRREHVLPNRSLYAIDGDDDVIYAGMWTPDVGYPGQVRGGLWKLRANDFNLMDTHNLGTSLPTSIAGDVNGCWVTWWRLATPEQPGEIGLTQYTSELSPVVTHAFPLIDEGHRPGGIGGGSERIYYVTSVSEADANDDWGMGAYLHTVRPADFTIVRSYGPFVSEKTPWAIGGK